MGVSTSIARTRRVTRSGRTCENQIKREGLVSTGKIEEDMVKYYTPKETLFLPTGYNFNMPPIHPHDGDDGKTGLLGEGRLPKYHPRVETLGVLDETSAALGLARSLCKDPQTEGLLKTVQRDLYKIMSEVAASPENARRFHTLDPERIQWLESQADAITARVHAPVEFTLPGDTLPGAAIALARTIARRAERRVAEMLDTGEIENRVLLQYLNRLSSLCFALELHENAQAGKPTSLAKEK